MKRKDRGARKPLAVDRPRLTPALDWVQLGNLGGFLFALGAICLGFLLNGCAPGLAPVGGRDVCPYVRGAVDDGSMPLEFARSSYPGCWGQP